MNREIKFRAQKSNNNEIVYFDLKYFLENDEDEMPDGMQYVLKNIQQFTGLLDKNGKEIFEGDIVKYFRSNGETKIGRIFYNTKRVGFEVRVLKDDDYGFYSFLTDICLHIKVIGNTSF